jgi:CRISPR system Cascade subunit CasA
LLIGLLATASPPHDHDGWLEMWDKPPAPTALDAAFEQIAHAFALDGDGPRFLQDFEELVSDPEPIERLLIEAPGASTTHNNTDLLVHRSRYTTLGRAAAAIALFTFQSWAPAGGAGNRTGLRGGGPLTTLVLPRSEASIWHILWANVPCGTPPPAADLPRVFP